MTATSPCRKAASVEQFLTRRARRGAHTRAKTRGDVDRRNMLAMRDVSVVVGRRVVETSLATSSLCAGCGTARRVRSSTWTRLKSGPAGTKTSGKRIRCVVAIERCDEAAPTRARGRTDGRTDGRTKAWVREIFRQHPLEIKLCRPFLARSDECRRGIETRDGKTDEEPFDMRSRIVFSLVRRRRLPRARST